MATKITPEMLNGEKLTYELVEEYVVHNGFGTSFYAHTDTDKKEEIYLSKGIELAYLTESISMKEVVSAIDRFCKQNDFGTFYDWDEKPTPEKEYGEYPSSFGDTANTGAIMIHRENGHIIVYFQFER